ncbi:3-oxoadipate enol-lactonase [Aliiruegeria sabulilitoris]|uniref:3-oxoadipate enol-lactonase n=1 Tax=Aliiruegeria sabulilitoris TaxID=1510458 RepID=UPI00083230A6|nr:3-oxoadipate enol-lactonase [Aliiruegeria sabulilitoris]NDR56208.1 3-oxoadipate enol-lactonase [Pseudoruegeria sp. M32A2M]
MRMIEANGVALHVREDGDRAGRPVVFSNSLGTDLRLWDAILPLLPAGLRIIRYDKRGHGLSDCPKGPYALDDLVADAEALLEALDIRDCVFVGLSIGGLIGQGLSARRPDLIRAAVLSNTAARMGEPEMWQARMEAIRAGGLESIAEAVMDRWFGPAFRKRPEVAAWKNMMIRLPQEGYLGCCAAISAADLTESTAALTLPVLGISGARDGACPPENTAATIRSIVGARMETIPDAGHLPCVEDPETYARLLAEFLKETGHV